MNDYKRIKNWLKISDVMVGESYSVEQIWEHQFVTQCVNPLHKDDNPSLQINEREQYAKCFACGIWGDVFNILWYIHPELKWKRLLNYVENEYMSGSWETIISPLYGWRKKNIQDEKWFREMMWYIALYWSQSIPKDVLDTYLTGSKNIAYKWYKWDVIKMQWYGLSTEIIEEYLLGYSPNNTELYKFLLESYDKEQIEATQLFDTRGLPKFKNRLTIPYIKDWEVVYFTARQTSSTPINKYDNSKYINQSIDNKYLYNEDDVINVCVFITEWPFDCLALKNKGYNAIALWWIDGSKKLSNYYEELEHCYLVYICFDNDGWNKWAWNIQSQKLDGILSAHSISSHQVVLPLLGKDKIDISEYLWNNEKEELNKLLSF